MGPSSNMGTGPPRCVGRCAGPAGGRDSSEGGRSADRCAGGSEGRMSGENEERRDEDVGDVVDAVVCGERGGELYVTPSAWVGVGVGCGCGCG